MGEKRMLDEAVNHCKERQVRGRSLFSYDQVQQRLSRLQSAYTISRLSAIHMVLTLGETGFNQKLIDSSLLHIAQEVSGLLGSYRFAAATDYIEGYGEDSSWFEEAT